MANMRVKYEAKTNCFLGYLKDVYVKIKNVIICALTDLNHISKWIFLAFALFLRTRSHIYRLESP